MKRIFRLSILTAIFGIAMYAVSCKKETIIQLDDITIVIPAGSITALKVGETLSITVEFTPPDATKKSITVESDNPAVATVEKTATGWTITGKSLGTAKITAKSADGSIEKSIFVTVFEQGNGTEAKPFKVYDIATLKKVGSNSDGWTLSVHYEQIAHIDIGSIANWTPIGTNSNPFTGTYNGGGYSITNLTINSTNQFTGLFSKIQTGGTVKNLALVAVNITGTKSDIGSVAGTNSGMIQNCYVTGKFGFVTFSGTVVGSNWVYR